MSSVNYNRQYGREILKKYLPADVDCKTIDSEFMATVQNLGAAGAFIKTEKPLSIGQEIALTIKFPLNGDTIKATGGIVRITSEGIGVELRIFFSK